MKKSPTESEQPPPTDPKRIAKLARTYAQNRSLGVVVFMMVFMVLCAAIGGPSYLAGVAYRSGNMPLFWVSIAVLVPAHMALIYFSVPKWGGMLMVRVTERLYAKEGKVAFSVPGESKKVWGLVLMGYLVTCVLASVAMGFVIEIPIKYMQPISALYFVPFLVAMWFLMRPMAGYLTLLWPALYATHAILIVAGAPILFTGPWEVLNMLIPTAGYGMLSALVSHLYSRVALAQLKKLTQADQPEEVSGQ